LNGSNFAVESKVYKTMKQVRFYNRVIMSSIGYGVFQIQREVIAKAVSEVSETGYRMVDITYVYFNEKEVGEAIRKNCLKRENIFVSTKL
jgi:hypothetical protein